MTTCEFLDQALVAMRRIGATEASVGVSFRGDIIRESVSCKFRGRDWEASFDYGPATAHFPEPMRSVVLESIEALSRRAAD